MRLSDLPIPETFAVKKRKILSSLGQTDYSDKSPKGTVDAQIESLIAEINHYPGLVTTSSCSGRVAVFVEGGRSSSRTPEEDDNNIDGDNTVNPEESVTQADEAGRTITGALDATGRKAKVQTSAGGKGGGHWLYVSHDPIKAPPEPTTDYFTSIFHLQTSSAGRLSAPPPSVSSLRLIHLQFSPLILHIHCATLNHARPLLSAAINAGFRESGVQSLRILEEPEKGVMVAVRTAGLGFETVVGRAVQRSGIGRLPGEDEHRQDTEHSEEDEAMEAVVGEDYLRMCAAMVNERFQWNEVRRERFRRELELAMNRELSGSSIVAESNLDGRTKQGRKSEAWEDKEERRQRKRQEGLMQQRQQQQQKHDEATTGGGIDQVEKDILNDDLGLQGTG